MEPDNVSQIKKIIEELLVKMDFDGKVVPGEGRGDLCCFNIVSSEAGYLIGPAGETLRALQQVIRLVANKGRVEPLKFVVDVNDYQSIKLNSLVAQANQLAGEVIGRQAPQWLPPMNSYERRVVHLALSQISGVKTDSEGEGEARRIVVRPA